MSESVTESQISEWVGNDGYSEKREAWMLETLTQIANGEYSAEQLRNDVAEYGE